MSVSFRIYAVATSALLSLSSVNTFSGEIQGKSDNCLTLLSPVDEMSAQYAISMRRLGVPIEQQDDQPLKAGGLPRKRTLEAGMRLYGSYFENHPEANQLLQILTESNPNALKTRLNTWIDRNISQRSGFRVLTLDEIKLEMKSNPRLSSHDAWEITNEGFIKENLFMALIDAKIIPVGNDHDLITHLPLLAIPEIAELTHKIGKTYTQSTFDSESIEVMRMQNIIQDICITAWQGVQERTLFLSKDNHGKSRIASMGGYAHVFAWKWAKPRKFNIGLAKRTLFPYPLEGDRIGHWLNDLYLELSKEVSARRPSTEAVALHRFFIEEMGFVPSTHTIEHIFNEELGLEMERLVRYVKAGKIDDALSNLATEISYREHPLIKTLYDQNKSLRFWELHVDYAHRLLSRIL
jgi:hypothetical protein